MASGEIEEEGGVLEHVAVGGDLHGAKWSALTEITIMLYNQLTATMDDHHICMDDTGAKLRSVVAAYERDSTLIIEVDLACGTCCTKIQKVLCKIQVKENVKGIFYETNKNEVIISGWLKPQQLYHKLRCKADCVIKGYKIPDKKPNDNEKKPNDRDVNNAKGVDGDKEKGGEKTIKVEPKNWRRRWWLHR
ncbi:hypothetical protein E2562_018369 [Oryza meyeriana var. granulata]|uniref:HMA domain-containing protein n=1 Tax=Oryza meyeriana var. granulata TaxID=110450 RepID=A0A6G1D5A3_9ORYZ|nr:hypothetical protein E2562_018369 [Oryza meyeriana var. granulata]